MLRHKSKGLSRSSRDSQDYTDQTVVRSALRVVSTRQQWSQRRTARRATRNVRDAALTQCRSGYVLTAGSRYSLARHFAARPLHVFDRTSDGPGRQRRPVAAAADQRGARERAASRRATAPASRKRSPACTTIPAVELIVTDLHMPGIDGWQFCQLLRSPEYRALQRRADPGRLGDVLRQRRRATQRRPRRRRLSRRAVRAVGAAGLRARAARAASARDPAPRAAARPPRRGGSERGCAPPSRTAATSVEVAHSGADALRAWRAHHPDVAVIDDRPARPVRRTGAGRDQEARLAHRRVHDHAATRPSRDGLQLARQRRRRQPARAGRCRAPGRPLRHGAPPALAAAHRGAARGARPRPARLRSALALAVRGDPRDRRRARRGRRHPPHQPDRRRAAGVAGARAHRPQPARARAADAARRRRAARRPTTAAPASTACTWRAAAARSPSRSTAGACTFEGQPAVLSVARDVSARRELERQRQTLPRHAHPRHQEPARRSCSASSSCSARSAS